VELVNQAGGCFFPTTRLEVYTAAGTVVDLLPLAASTTCYGAPTYFWLANSAAEQTFGLPADTAFPSALPDSGQICIASSGTRYDCVRWGAVDPGDAVVDLFGATDTTATGGLSDAAALARLQTSHIVVDDWGYQAPTPRAPNDGTPWFPPDAGPSPDAAVPADAGPIFDAGPRPDAHPPPDARVDAGNRRYLDLDARGGASCGCQGAGASSASLAFLVLALPTVFRRRAAAERRAGPRS
jgi:hypothetical protein